MSKGYQVVMDINMGYHGKKNNHHVLGSLAGDNDLIFHGDIEPTFDDTSL
jgi:hypothetical protein